MTAKKNPTYEEINQSELTTEKCSRRKARENAVGIILLIGGCVSGANYLSQSNCANPYCFFLCNDLFLGLQLSEFCFNVILVYL